MSPQITKLKNGLTVVTDPMPHLESAAIGVWVNAGARHESEPTNGIAHMLEHMAFKGTKRRNARQIVEEIERVGGHINAHTGYEQTAYYIRVLKNDVPLAVDILADILQDSIFDEDELAREQGVIIQEIGQVEDNPDDIIGDHLQAIAYPNQPLGRPILGTAKHVQSFTPKALRTHVETHYFTSSMLLISAGAVEHTKMVALAEQAFSRLQHGTERTPDAGRYGGGEFRAADELEQVHIALAFEGLSSTHDDYFAEQVYSTLLGGGMSSRLFQEAREKRGFCYAISSFSPSFRDTGLFGVYAGTSADDVSKLIDVVAAEMRDVAEQAGEDETARARAQIKASVLMGLEHATARCEQIAGQLFTYGRLMTTDELVERIDAVDTKAVSRVAAKVLSGGKLTLAVMGPVSKLGSYDHVAQRFA